MHTAIGVEHAGLVSSLHIYANPNDSPTNSKVDRAEGLPCFSRVLIAYKLHSGVHLGAGLDSKIPGTDHAALKNGAIKV